MSSSNLPAYEAPPVVEVAVSVQFPPIANLDAARLGLAWLKYRGTFPKVETMPRLNRIVERFGPPGPTKVDVQLEEAFPPVRLWFVTDDGTRLVQVQRDRFAFNWRKQDTEVAYPHYDQLRAEFEQHFETFTAFLDEESLSVPEPDQVELTYVNHIRADGESTSPAPLERYVRLWSGVPDEAALPSAESAAFQTQFVFHRGTSPIGRLYIQVQSRFFKADNRPLYHLQLIGRGAPVDNPGLPGVLSFLDHAHVWIVRGFTDITTKEMHQEWRRQR